MPQISASASPANTLPIVFAHANSFPLDTYRLLFSLLRQRGIAASGVQRFGHDPARPVTNHWPHLVDELIGFTAGVALGGDGRAALGPLRLEHLADAPRLTLQSVETLGGDILHRWRR